MEQKIKTFTVDYEKICDLYYDEFFIDENQVRCYGCNKGFLVNKVFLSKNDKKIKYGCEQCFIKKDLKICSVCKIFIKNYIFPMYLDNIEYLSIGDKIYCKNCRPNFEFEFHIIGDPIERKTILQIPRGNEWKIGVNWIIKCVSHYLNIPDEKLTIWGMYRGTMICPVRYQELNFEMSITD